MNILFKQETLNTLWAGLCSLEEDHTWTIITYIIGILSEMQVGKFYIEVSAFLPVIIIEFPT